MALQIIRTIDGEAVFAAHVLRLEFNPFHGDNLYYIEAVLVNGTTQTLIVDLQYGEAQAIINAIATDLGNGVGVVDVEAIYNTFMANGQRHGAVHRALATT